MHVKLQWNQIRPVEVDCCSQTNIRLEDWNKKKSNKQILAWTEVDSIMWYLSAVPSHQQGTSISVSPFCTSLVLLISVYGHYSFLNFLPVCHLYCFAHWYHLFPSRHQAGYVSTMRAGSGAHPAINYELTEGHLREGEESKNTWYSKHSLKSAYHTSTSRYHPVGGFLIDSFFFTLFVTCEDSNQKVFNKRSLTDRI